MVEEVKYTETKVKPQSLHKKIVHIWTNGFISGCLFALGVVLLVTEHYIMMLIAFLICILGYPTRRLKNE